MSYVITDQCAGPCQAECFNACPVDAIHGPVEVREFVELRRKEGALSPNSMRLFIDPEQFICCAGCEPECPVGAVIPPAW